MKVTRKFTGKQILAQQQSRKKRTRRSRRVLSDAKQVCYSEVLDQSTNNPYQFSFADYNRNEGRIQLLKTRFDDMIRINGVNLIYYRKFNTFFQDQQNNYANMIYGEDTTAQFFLSGQVRAFLSIGKQQFAFNMLGYEAQQEIQIWMTIADFRARFATVLGDVKTELFSVPVTGDAYTGEYYGIMDIPQFYAQIYGQLGQKNYVQNAYPIIKQRTINSEFYESLDRISYLQPLTGFLNGYLVQPIPDETFKVSGYLKGQISYHSYENIKNSPTWNVAPQVGDYFKFKVGDIQQEYQINQVLDKQMTKDGLNPLLGRYLYKCKAVRRVPSQQVHNNIAQEDIQIGSDINQELQNTNFRTMTEQQSQKNYAQYTKKKKKTKQNIENKITNKIAKGIYDYKDNEDEVYGGYTDRIPSEQIEYFHKKD